MSNESKHTSTATDYFVYRLGEEPKTASEKLTVVMMAEYAESLRAANAELVEALRGMVYIVQDSSGVYGYHKNGDLADWDDFNEVDNAQTTLAKHDRP